MAIKQRTTFNIHPSTLPIGKYSTGDMISFCGFEYYENKFGSNQWKKFNPWDSYNVSTPLISREKYLEYVDGATWLYNGSGWDLIGRCRGQPLNKTIVQRTEELLFTASLMWRSRTATNITSYSYTSEILFGTRTYKSISNGRYILSNTCSPYAVQNTTDTYFDTFDVVTGEFSSYIDQVATRIAEPPCTDGFENVHAGNYPTTHSYEEVQGVLLQSWAYEVLETGSTVESKYKLTGVINVDRPRFKETGSFVNDSTFESDGFFYANAFNALTASITLRDVYSYDIESFDSLTIDMLAISDWNQTIKGSFRKTVDDATIVIPEANEVDVTLEIRDSKWKLDLRNLPFVLETTYRFYYVERFTTEVSYQDSSEFYIEFQYVGQDFTDEVYIPVPKLDGLTTIISKRLVKLV